MNNQKSPPEAFIVDRVVHERRAGRKTSPPFLTNEGLVLVDRRECMDRRANRQRQKQGAV